MRPLLDDIGGESDLGEGNRTSLAWNTTKKKGKEREKKACAPALTAWRLP